jgi:hypothetical protein
MSAKSTSRERLQAPPLTICPVKNGTLKTYKGFPHGMPTTPMPKG